MRIGWIWLGVLVLFGEGRAVPCDSAGGLHALRRDGTDTRASAQGCGPSRFCLEAECVPEDSVVALRADGEDEVAFRRRAARLLADQGSEGAAAKVLLPLHRRPGISDSVRLELASALFFSGRYEEGLGLNYALDSLRGPFEAMVLNQRREFFQLLGMDDEVAKLEERRLAAELGTLPKPRPFWVPRLTLGLSLGHSRLTQDVDTGGLKTILDRWVESQASGEGGVAYSDALLNQALSQGGTQSMSGALRWDYAGRGWGAQLRGGAVRTHAGELEISTDAEFPLHSYQVSAGASLSWTLLGVEWGVDLDWWRKQYVSAGRWWSRGLQGGLQVSGDLGGGMLWASAGVGDNSSRSIPDGYLSWQGNAGYSRKVPGLSWLDLGVRSGIERHRLPGVTTDAARIAWAEGLAAGKSTLDRSIVHYRDSSGTSVDAVNPFTGVADLTYHSGRSVLQERQVYAQYSPSLGMDLRIALPWQLGLRGGLDLTWTRSLEKVALGNSRGAASENGELLVWRDRKTGQDYIFASSTTASTLELLQVEERVRQDLTRSLSCGLSWSPALLGSFSAGMSWSWGDVEPYAIDPASRYTSWGWNLGWSRTW